LLSMSEILELSYWKEELFLFVWVELLAMGCMQS
jgi:hypothetical protein